MTKKRITIATTEKTARAIGKALKKIKAGQNIVFEFNNEELLFQIAKEEQEAPKE